MLLKARTNAAKLGFNNVSFVEGDIEQMPLPDALTDVIISNCVLNLVPDKAKAFAEMYRVLKPGGHFCVSDIVLARPLPTAIQQAAELYAGCVSGAILEQDYLQLIATAGFAGVDVPKRREIHVPAQILLQYIDKEQFADFRRQGGVIYSITVRGTKPLV
jgi:arsenite methyltransferase